MRSQLAALLLGLIAMAASWQARAVDPEDLPYSDRVHLQQSLIRGDWLTGKADGDIGPKSRRAIEAFERSQGNGADGDLTPSELQALMPGPAEVGGFETLEHVDLPYNDIRSGLDDPALRDIDLRACQSLCSDTSMCVAYTYNVPYRTCFLKSDGSDEQPFEGAISGRRLASVSSSQDRSGEPGQAFRTLVGFDLPENDLRSGMSEAALKGITQQACEAACGEDTQCKAYTYNVSAKMCFLKSSAAEPTAYSKAISGIRADVVATTVASAAPLPTPPSGYDLIEPISAAELAKPIAACAAPPANFWPERKPLNNLHGSILAFLDKQNVPMGGFDGSYRYEYDAAGAKALLPQLEGEIADARGKGDRDTLGILLFDMTRLAYVADGQGNYLDYRKEAEALLDGTGDNAQAVDIGVAIHLPRGTNESNIDEVYGFLDNHRRLFGPVPRQWLIYDLITAYGNNYEPTIDELAIRDAAFAARIKWAEELGDRRFVLDAFGAFLAEQRMRLTGGRQPEPGQLQPLLSPVRMILDEVAIRADADVRQLTPFYEGGAKGTKPCLQVSSTTVGAIASVIMAEGTQQERDRTLSFSVLHTLDPNLFATEVAGVEIYANDLLQLRLVRPELYKKAAEFVSASLSCLPQQPRLACTEQAFAGVYSSLNRGTIALDFQRAALAATSAAVPASTLETYAARQLALYEWKSGSVARAQDLMQFGLRDEELDVSQWDYTKDYAYTGLRFDLAVLNRDDAAIEQLISTTMKDRAAEEATIPPTTSTVLDTPPPDAMIDRYIRGDICGRCSTALQDAVDSWLRIELSQGSPRALLQLRLLPVERFSDAEREQIGTAYLRWLTDPRPENYVVLNGRGQFSEQVLRQIRQMRGKPMSDFQLATVVALAQSHPHFDEFGEQSLFDFAQFLFEARVQKKQQLYDRMLERNYTLLDEFGMDDSYFAGLSTISEMAYLTGYELAGRVVDRHIVKMFEEKLGYLDENEALQEAARVEDAEILAPAYVRLARAEFAANRTKSGVEFLDLAGQASAEALDTNWQRGDPRAVEKYNRLAPHLIAASEMLVQRASSQSEQVGRAFAALQLAMLGDTALSAQAAQRRRLLVDPAAESALVSRDTARDALLLLDYYRTQIGIRDREWEETETARRKASLAQAQAALDRVLPQDQSVTIAPMSVDEARELLREDETLIILHSGVDAIYGMAVTKSGSPTTWVSDLSSEKLLGTVTRIRQSLEVSSDGTLQADFPFVDAHELYEKLLGPTSATVGNRPRLLVTVDGSLQLLPLSILPTRMPEKLPQTIDEFRSADITWLGAEKSLLYLPTVASLRDRASQAKPAPRAFAGVGNPQFSRQPSVTVETASFDGVYDAGGLADVNFLNSLAPLPETQVEVFAMAQLSGATPEDVLVADAANETRLKEMALDQYRLLLIATHGLVAGEAGGLSEPGLVLTPPKAPSSADDGYLGLSEIMSLRLNADLVILSACNTAASDGRQGSTGLSGLARAFLVAGAKSVAVTHWSIPSAATLSLNVRWVEAKKSNSNSDWADALREAIKAMVQTEGPSSFAHPSNWGAFEIFGAPVS